MIETSRYKNDMLNEFDLNYIYQLFLLNDRTEILKNFFYILLNISFDNKNKIKEKKFKFTFKIKKNIFEVYEEKNLIVSFNIKDNKLKTYLIFSQQSKFTDALQKKLIKVLFTNYLIYSNSKINFLLNPVLYEKIKNLNVKVSLLDTIDTLFPFYGSLNYFENFFSSIGNIETIELYKGGYYIKSLIDQKIYDYLIDKIIDFYDKINNKILFIIFHSVLKIDNKKIIDNKNTKKFKKNLIKKFLINDNLYYNKIGKEKDCTFELIFLMNKVNTDNIIIQDIYNKLLIQIKNFKI